ncbi:hypothetical protein FACS189418_0850 [Clostridia bacterium]|nr:hypothetical protein FACS189418_0850 [Clostridia bacterium]
MKIQKKIYCLLFLVLFMVNTLPVFAASGINEFEQKILNVLSERISASHVNIAKNYFNRDGIDVMAEESEKAIKELRDAYSIIDQNPVNGKVVTESTIEKLPRSIKEQVLNHAVNAASALGMTLTWNASKRTFSLLGKDKSIIPLENNIIKQTGIRTSTTYWLTGIILVLIIAIILMKRPHHRDRDPHRKHQNIS